MNPQQLQQLTLQWRATYTPLLYFHVAGTVQSGPFRNMRLLPEVCWGDGDQASKLLGLYEDELHEYIHGIQDPDLIINIGCAEGYYAVGLARLWPVRTVAADTDSRAQRITGENAQLNSARVHTRGEMNTGDLEQELAAAQRPVVIMDSEGAEAELLNPVTVPSLAHTTVLVESHDCFVPDITNTLLQRFAPTHHCTRIRAQGKNPWQFEFLDQISDLEKLILVNECRPQTAQWIWMEPK